MQRTVMTCTHERLCNNTDLKEDGWVWSQWIFTQEWRVISPCTGNIIHHWLDKNQQMQILSSANNMHYKHLPMVWCSLGFRRINTIYYETMESSPMNDRDEDTLGFDYLYTVLPPSPTDTLSTSPKWLLQAIVIITNICVNRTARTATRYCEAGWTAVVNPDPEVTAGETVQCHIVYPSTRPNLQIRIHHCWQKHKNWNEMRRAPICDIFHVPEMVLWKCCMVFTIYCKSFYFLHIFHTAFHYVPLKQNTCRKTASNTTSWEIQESYSQQRRISEVHELSITSVSTISNYLTEATGYAALPAPAKTAAFGMASCLYFMSSYTFHATSKNITPSHIYYFHNTKIKN